MKHPEPFILHIMEAIENIERYVDGMDEAAFLKDDKTHYAVIKMFEIIGEATGHFEDNFKGQFQDIDWQKIKDFRNKLVHDYWEIDFEYVWKVTKKNIPQLKEALLPIYSQINKDDIIEDWDD